MRQPRGFTLIELAVVLFVGTLILGGIVQYLALQVATAKITATRTKQDAIKSALVNYIARNNQLPCPADPVLSNGDPLNGVAKAAGVCAGGGVVTTAVIAQGAVPWATLGLSREAALDGYGNRFTYQVVISATNLQALPAAGQQTISGMKGAITLHSAGPAIVAPAVGANQTNSCTPGTPTDNPCLAVVVIVSHGADGFGAYTDGGVQIAFPASVVGNDARENANADSAFVVKTYSNVDANPFDDVVLALNPNDLLSALTSSGGLQDARGLLYSSLNVIKNAVANASLLSATPTCVAGSCTPPAGSLCEPSAATTPCQVTRYEVPATMPALPGTVTTDPWGNAIVYQQGVTPITPTVTAGNAFTLKSLGPNGVDNACAAGSDDICVSVSVSEFQALTSKAR